MATQNNSYNDLGSTLVARLKDLYVKLGGSLTDIEDIVIVPDMIDAIAEVVDKGDENANVK